jgi:hypothetical protein
VPQVAAARLRRCWECLACWQHMLSSEAVQSTRARAIAESFKAVTHPAVSPLPGSPAPQRPDRPA